MPGMIEAGAPEREPSAGDSGNSVKGFDRAAKLFDDLRAAGVDARPTPEGIEMNGPTEALTAELLDRLRTARDELLALLEWREERLAIAEADGELSPEAAERQVSDAMLGAEGAAPDPVPVAEAAAVDAGGGADRETAARGIGCPWCGPVELRDDPEGPRCDRCERLAWVVVGRSIIRADCVEDDLEGLAPEDVPTCPTCGRWCDVETVAGAWRCTRCDSNAEARRRRTQWILERAEMASRRRGVAAQATDCSRRKVGPRLPNQ